MNTALINAIVEAAEREGGIHMLEMPHGCKKWRDALYPEGLWYNNAITKSTHLIRLK